MPLDRSEGFSFALAFSRSMTTSWLRERQGKERGVEGSTGRVTLWTPGSGTAGSSEPPSQLSLLLRLSRCYVAGAAWTATRSPLHKGSDRPRQCHLWLHESRHSTKWGKATGVKGQRNAQSTSNFTTKLCYRPRRNQPISPGGVMKCGWRADTPCGTPDPPTLPAARPSFGRHRCSPLCGGEGPQLAVLINFILPTLGRKPQGALYKPRRQISTPLWFLSWCKKALGDLAKGGGSFSPSDVPIIWFGDGTGYDDKTFSFGCNFKGFLLFVLFNLRQSVLFPRNRWLTRWLILTRRDYTQMYVRAKIKQILSHNSDFILPFSWVECFMLILFSNLEWHDLSKFYGSLLLQC